MNGIPAENDPITNVLLTALREAVRLDEKRDPRAHARLTEVRAAFAAHGINDAYVQGAETAAREAARQPITCARCNGTGEVVARTRHVGGGAVNDDYDICPACGGNGFVMRSAA